MFKTFFVVLIITTFDKSNVMADPYTVCSGDKVLGYVAELDFAVSQFSLKADMSNPSGVCDCWPTADNGWILNCTQPFDKSITLSYQNNMPLQCYTTDTCNRPNEDTKAIPVKSLLCYNKLPMGWLTEKGTFLKTQGMPPQDAKCSCVDHNSIEPQAVQCTTYPTDFKAEDKVTCAIPGKGCSGSDY